MNTELINKPNSIGPSIEIGFNKPFSHRKEQRTKLIIVPEIVLVQ